MGSSRQRAGSEELVIVGAGGGSVRDGTSSLPRMVRRRSIGAEEIVVGVTPRATCVALTAVVKMIQLRHTSQKNL